MNDLCLAVAQIRARSGRMAESVEAHVRSAEIAAATGAKLVLFPELSLTGYSRTLTLADAIDPRTTALDPLREISRARDITIAVGAPLEGSSGLLIGNLSFCPDGSVRTHTKQHLHEGEEMAFVGGDGGVPLAVDGAKAGIAICADINYRSHAAAASASGASIYAASCFLTPRGYPTDCATLVEYATTFDLVVLMANYTGRCGGFESAGGSAIWDSTGRLLISAPSSGECVIFARWTGDTWVCGQCELLG
jgi:predicted amidohydrolase